jgi:hypothetical protein
MLAAGVISIAFSIVWRAPNVLRNIIISSGDLTSTHTCPLQTPPLTLFTVGLVLGIAYIITWIVSVGAIVQPTHVTIGLVVLNWALLGDAIITLVVGTIIWFFTLQERANFAPIFANASTNIRQGVQDAVN